MREIEFRAYNKKHGMRKLYGFNENFVFLDSLDSPDNTVLPREEWTLMQFTGLTDKNGKKIFEGDVLEVEGYNSRDGQWKKNFEVVFSDAAFCLRREETEYSFFGQRHGKIQLKKGIVAGNIYENPELLKEDK